MEETIIMPILGIVGGSILLVLLLLYVNKSPKRKSQNKNSKK